MIRCSYAPQKGSHASIHAPACAGHPSADDGVQGESAAAPVVHAALNYLAPEIQGEDTEGNFFKLSDYRGKVVLLDFGAEWCGWCKKFWPRGNRLVKKYKDQPFVVLGVNLDADLSTAKAIHDSGQASWRSWWDGRNSAIQQQWRVSGLPAFYLINARGVIRQIIEGYPGSELEEAIEVLVKDAEEES